MPSLNIVNINVVRKCRSWGPLQVTRVVPGQSDEQRPVVPIVCWPRGLRPLHQLAQVGRHRLVVHGLHLGPATTQAAAAAERDGQF